MKLLRRDFFGAVAGVSVTALTASSKDGSAHPPIRSGEVAWKLIQALPCDPEEPARALEFFGCLNDHLRSSFGLKVIKEVYGFAATGRWLLLQQDITMLLHGVRRNPELLSLVGPSVDHIINPFPRGTGIGKTWQQLKVQCQGKH